MLRAIFVCSLAVVAVAAALLAAEPRRAPPLAAEADRADLVVIDRSRRKLALFQADEMVFETRVALEFALLSDRRAGEDAVAEEGEYRIAGRQQDSKFYLALNLAGDRAEDDLVIHGQPNLVPGAVTLPGDWTGGGIGVSNVAMRTIWRRVATGTKVVVRP